MLYGTPLPKTLRILFGCANIDGASSPSQLTKSQNSSMEGFGEALLSRMGLREILLDRTHIGRRLCRGGCEVPGWGYKRPSDASWNPRHGRSRQCPPPASLTHQGKVILPAVFNSEHYCRSRGHSMEGQVDRRARETPGTPKGCFGINPFFSGRVWPKKEFTGRQALAGGCRLERLGRAGRATPGIASGNRAWRCPFFLLDNASPERLI